MRQAGNLGAFMQIMMPKIDCITAGLAAKRFIPDPINGPYYSRLSSICSSAQKRHGHIIEMSIREALKQSNKYRVWTESRFAISSAAGTLFSAQNEDACRASELPYGENYRTIQIDIGTFDDVNQTLSAYEVKRGNGRHDAGKVRSIRSDQICTHMLLKSYGQQVLGLIARFINVKAIFYYGQRSVSGPNSLAREDLDDHFDFPVVAHVEEANKYYAMQVHRILEEEQSVQSQDYNERMVEHERRQFHENCRQASNRCS